MSDVDNELQSRIDSFVSELTALVQRQALEAVEEVLKKGMMEMVQGLPLKVEAPKAKVPPPPPRPIAQAKAPAAPARLPGEKRSPEELANTVNKVYHYLQENSGQGVEHMARALNIPTKDLTLPIRKLLDDHKIDSRGQKRATQYFIR